MKNKQQSRVVSDPFARLRVVALLTVLYLCLSLSIGVGGTRSAFASVPRAVAPSQATSMQHMPPVFSTYTHVGLHSPITARSTTSVPITRYEHPVSSGCQTGEYVHRVASGGTLSKSALQTQTDWTALARLAHPVSLSKSQSICISLTNSSPVLERRVLSGVQGRSTRSIGNGNLFPYGQCTWWANERYSRLHGTFVPWTTDANAWQWTARAYDYGWRVSAQPSVGSIIDLQPWVQGAYGLGHVAVVEQVLPNGNAVTSNMNWGATPWSVTYVQFTPGPGVTFITR